MSANALDRYCRLCNAACTGREYSMGAGKCFTCASTPVNYADDEEDFDRADECEEHALGLPVDAYMKHHREINARYRRSK